MTRPGRTGQDRLQAGQDRTEPVAKPDRTGQTWSKARLVRTGRVRRVRPAGEPWARQAGRANRARPGRQLASLGRLCMASAAGRAGHTPVVRPDQSGRLRLWSGGRRVICCRTAERGSRQPNRRIVSSRAYMSTTASPPPRPTRMPSARRCQL